MIGSKYNLHIIFLTSKDKIRLCLCLRNQVSNLFDFGDTCMCRMLTIKYQGHT